MDRLPRLPVEGKNESLLRELDRGRDPAAINGEVGQNRRPRKIPVPDIVMGDLEVPDPPSGLDIERQKCVGVEIVSRPTASVIVVCWRLGRYVDNPSLVIHRKRRPRGGIPGDLGGAIEPAFIPGLAAKRYRLERPLEGASARIEGQDVARNVLEPGRIAAVIQGGADDDHSVGDDRG